MAAISLSPLPSSVPGMSGRRVPLSNNPNAVNSPFKAASATTASKTKRSHANVQREEIYAQPPPAKKQMLESHQLLKTPPRHQSTQSAAPGFQSRRDTGSQQVTHERKVSKIREKTQKAATKVEWHLTDDHESIRQWQKHYRRIFPSFVFYFENVSLEAQAKYTNAVMSLGAREDKFFSNTVTHVITTRTIPPQIQSKSTVSTVDSSIPQPQTIPPQMCRSSINLPHESTNSSESTTKSKPTLEASTCKKIIASCSNGDSKRSQGRCTDFLHKARELGMKIWSLEKLERIINVIFDTDAGYHKNQAVGSRFNINSTACRLGRETDLQQLLRNERIYGPSDRDLTVASKELYIFKGPYIYIHDIEQKQKPIMVREYPKVYNKEDGDWPQFRSVANGKCPFIDEVDYSKREAEKEMEKIRIRRQLDKERAYSLAKVTPTSTIQPKPMVNKRALDEQFDDANNEGTVKKQKCSMAKSMKSLSSNLDSKASVGDNAFVSRASIGRLHDGEPIASGVQPAITSAIRSTMSSTAAQPGFKAGTSKEVHGMQRKVLEKKTIFSSSHDSHSTRPIGEIKTSALAQKQTFDKSTTLEQKIDCSHVQDASEKTEITRKVKSIQQSTTTQQEPKPGYCENCQDKFEDFNEHVISRKHRKFAEKVENWKLLDELLAQLSRPLRENIDRKDNS
ncbi:putative g1 s regulator [Golovinomyces cichoracearum]|uniref:Putative g1 s regulator n=1 Tax=Golovinomyces cichoracearum TaxID=62708 RepID=A0A420JBC2_9PEZI|nr:putative g1 s regulator [Golovinomyces cichoracearum]